MDFRAQQKYFFHCGGMRLMFLTLFWGVGRKTKSCLDSKNIFGKSWSVLKHMRTLGLKHLSFFGRRSCSSLSAFGRLSGNEVSGHYISVILSVHPQPVFFSGVYFLIEGVLQSKYPFCESRLSGRSLFRPCRLFGAPWRPI